MSDINALIAQGSKFGNAFGNFADSYEEAQKIQQAQAYRNALLQQQQAQDTALAGRHKDQMALDRDKLAADTGYNNRNLNEQIRYHNAEIANSSRRAEPDAITEFKFALANGFKGNYADWLKEKSGKGDAPLYGNSADSYAISQMVNDGRLTKQQAADYLAGKTVTGQNGELSFLRPSDVYPQQQPQPAPASPQGQFGPRAAPTAPVAAPAAPSAGIQLRAGTPKEPNQFEKQSAGFHDRLVAADKLFDTPEVVAHGTARIEKGLYKLPFGNSTVSPEFQQYEQARNDFATAKLRLESGATIQPSEFETDDRTFFPQPGDDEKVLKQKKEARTRIIAGFRRDAGRALEGGSGGPQQKSSTGVSWSLEP